MEVELHQRSALSPFLFVMALNRLTMEVRKSATKSDVVDGIVLCSDSR